MLQSIVKSSRFQQDLKKYNDNISKIPEGQFKEECKKLLSKLITEVKKLDDMHLEMVYTKQLSSLGDDFRDRIVSLRKDLDQKIKDFNRS